MSKPVRLQLSRRRGFRLQEHSRTVNGLEAVNVARPSKWGNPARIGVYFKTGDPAGYRGLFRMSWCIVVDEFADDSYTFIDNNETAVEMFRQLVETGYFTSRIDELAGKNLACFCKIGEPCHADVLLELANPDLSED